MSSIQRFKQRSLFIGGWLLSVAALSATTIVGNGDVGNDLEGAKPIREGKIIVSRDKAIEQMKALNANGIIGLGRLVQELKSSELYRAEKDVMAELGSDQGSFHSNMGGKVYARTEAENTAPTRFFPIAETLSEDQLVALHIHEALHRALDPKIREDETIVAQITLALTSPTANFDHVQKRMTKIHKDHGIVDDPTAGMALVEVAPQKPGRYEQPSQVSYEFREFLNSDQTSWQPAERIHIVRSEMYPFGTDNHPIGLSLELSAVQLESKHLFGPMGVGLQMKAWSAREFDVDFWAKASLQMLSDDEVKESPLGRDLYQLGVLFSKSTRYAYFENRWGLMLGGEAEQTLGPLSYTYEYGAVVNTAIAAGAKIGAFHVGGYLDVLLGNRFAIRSEQFNEDFGRYRIISGGPRVAFKQKSFEAFASAHFILNQTADADFNYVGDLLGPGVSGGNWSVGFNYYF